MTSSLRRHLLLAGALLAFAVLLVAISSRHHDEFASPDEPAQLDYVLAIPHVPATGDLLSDQALEDLSTNGLADGGYSSAGATPPVYYVVTAVVARPVAAVTGWSVLSVARWTGAVWLALFVAVAAALARALGCPRSPPSPPRPSLPRPTARPPARRTSAPTSPAPWRAAWCC